MTNLSKAEITGTRENWTLAILSFGAANTIILHDADADRLRAFCISEATSVSVRCETGRVYTVTCDDLTSTLTFDGGAVGTFTAKIDRFTTNL